MVSHTYILRLGYSRNSILYNKINKKNNPHNFLEFGIFLFWNQNLTSSQKKKKKKEKKKEKRKENQHLTLFNDRITFNFQLTCLSLFEGSDNRNP